jgi:hypothetical protein
MDKKRFNKSFPFPPQFFVVVGSGIQDGKIFIQNKHPGFTTLIF